MAAVTWNPSDKNAFLTLSNGNLTVKNTNSSGAWGGVRATLSRSTGKYYFEGRLDTKFNTVISPQFGVALAVTSLNNNFENIGNLLGIEPSATIDYAFKNFAGGGNQWQQFSPPRTVSGDVLGHALDLDAGKIWMAVNNLFLFSGNPAAGTNPTWTFTPNSALFPFCVSAGNPTTVPTLTARFKSSSFSYAPPAGFSPWEATPLSPRRPMFTAT